MTKPGTLLAALAAALALSLGLTPAARAGHWWWWGTKVFHPHEPHRPGIPFYNGADDHGDMRRRAEYARGQWSGTLPINMGNVGSPREAHLAVHDGYWQEDWLSLNYYECPCDYATGHFVRMNALMNLSQLAANPAYDDWRWRQATACQAIGHGLGMTHAGPGCMGVGHGVDPFAPGARQPSAHDLEHLDALYRDLH